MECITAFCLYLSASAGTSLDSMELLTFKRRGLHTWTQPMGDTIGQVVVGVEHRSGFYFELDHQSGIFNPEDEGINLARIGYRFTFNVGK